MPETQLTPVQEQVIAAVTGGATIIAAADAASIHRNTVSYWRRTSRDFRDALRHALYDKAVFIREEAAGQVTDAYRAIHAILTNPAASDAARLNAAKFIIEKASTAPPPEPEPVIRIEPASIAEILGIPDQTPPPEPSEIMNSPAPTLPPEQPENVNSPAQSHAPQPIRSGPKVGRNEPCPCGSHLKFKRCCLGKSPSAMAA